MRVATNTFPDLLVNQLNQLNARQTRLQNQTATGQRVQWADDDPGAMQQALGLQADSRANQQYGANISLLQERVTTSVSAMQSAQTVIDRAGEIAVLADGTKSPQELNAYASEVDQLIRQAVTAGNSQARDAYVFGGTQGGQAPFGIAEDASGQVASVTYHGNTETPELDIADGTPLSAQVPGANSTGVGQPGFFADSRAGADVFSHLISLRDHLASGDTAAIAATDRPAVAKDEDNALYQIANAGAIQARLQTATTATTNRGTVLQQDLSQEVDADLSQTLVQLNSAQTAYRAALQSGANLLNTSLLDYLH